MGEIADQLVDDEIFRDHEEDLPRPKNFYRKRTEVEKKVASIRKEIAMDIKSGTDVNEARRKANAKYGHGWREWR